MIGVASVPFTLMSALFCFVEVSVLWLLNNASLSCLNWHALCILSAYLDVYVLRRHALMIVIAFRAQLRT